MYILVLSVQWCTASFAILGIFVGDGQIAIRAVYYVVVFWLRLFQIGFDIFIGQFVSFKVGGYNFGTDDTCRHRYYGICQ